MDILYTNIVYLYCVCCFLVRVCLFTICVTSLVFLIFSVISVDIENKKEEGEERKTGAGTVARVIRTVDQPCRPYILLFDRSLRSCSWSLIQVLVALQVTSRNVNYFHIMCLS